MKRPQTSLTLLVIRDLGSNRITLMRSLTRLVKMKQKISYRKYWKTKISPQNKRARIRKLRNLDPRNSKKGRGIR